MRYFQNYFDQQAKISDFSCIQKVISVFRLKGQGTVSSMWGWGRGKQQSNNKKVSIFTGLGYSLDEKRPHDFIWSVEECNGIMLQDELETRRKYKNPFTFDEVLLMAQSLMTAVYTLHKLGIAHKRIKPSNIYYCSGGSIKVSGVAEPTLEFYERLQIYGGSYRDNRDQIYTPPEQLTSSFIQNSSSYGSYNNVNPFKQDAWAIGVVLLQIATLATADDLKDIHSSNSSCLNKYLTKMKDLYGYQCFNHYISILIRNGLSDIVTVITTRNPKDRSDLQEQIQQVYQTHLVPMHKEFFDEANKCFIQPKLIRYKV